MSRFYNAQRLSSSCYHPESKEPFKISRSKIDLFLECARCFYTDRRLGVSRPPGFPFSLNSAVDTLLKKEFDFHRVQKTPHPLMESYGVDAVPFEHKDLNQWRDNFTGVRVLHKKTNFLVFGAVDDIWINPAGELLVVDYKATAKQGQVNLDADWQIGYKRQIEVYQWLLRHNDFLVSQTGYFVYCNGNADAAAFDKKLEFEVTVLPYEGDDGWIDGALEDAKKCLDDPKIPPPNPECDYCAYRQAAAKAAAANG